MFYVPRPLHFNYRGGDGPCTTQLGKREAERVEQKAPPGAPSHSQSIQSLSRCYSVSGVGRYNVVALLYADCSLCPIIWSRPLRLRRFGLPKPYQMVKCRGARSLVNDLITGQGVVSSSAALTLRSVETYPLIG